MPSFRTIMLAVVAAALAATAIARWQARGADVPAQSVQGEGERQHKAPADLTPDAPYLPDLFVDEERAAPIEPLPPQF